MRITLRGPHYERHRAEHEARMADPAERRAWQHDVAWQHALIYREVAHRSDLAYARRADGRGAPAATKRRTGRRDGALRCRRDAR